MNTLKITPETQVSKIAAHYPATLRMMEALGIDYCCGGKLPLTEASAKAGLPVETTISVLQASIAQAASAPNKDEDWLHADLQSLMAHILQKHHTYMHEELPRLEHILGTVARVHGSNHGKALNPLVKHFTALKIELDAHLKKEEEITFPAISRLVAGEMDSAAIETINELINEHEAAGEMLAAMRKDTFDYRLPEDACNTFNALYSGLRGLELDIHRHINLENNILFPNTLELIEEEG